MAEADALPSLLADLRALSHAELDAVLTSLAADERNQLERLLARSAAPERPLLDEAFSPWLRGRLAQGSGGGNFRMTPAARHALQDAAAAVLGSGAPVAAVATRPSLIAAVGAWLFGGGAAG